MFFCPHKNVNEWVNKWMNTPSQNGLFLPELQKQFFILNSSHSLFRFSIIIGCKKSVCPTWLGTCWDKQSCLTPQPVLYHSEVQSTLDEWICDERISQFTRHFCLTVYLCCLFIVSIVNSLIFLLNLSHKPNFWAFSFANLWASNVTFINYRYLYSMAQRIRKHPLKGPLVRPPCSLNKWAPSPGNKDALKCLSGHSLPAAGRTSPLSKS